MSECNKMIRLMLNGKVECSENLFGVFCLFANKILTIDDVLRAAEKENINMVDVCDKNGLSFKKILLQQ